MSDRKIPIKNIYNMLCYVWGKLDEIDKTYLDAIENLDSLDFYSLIFIHHIELIIKRGLLKEYKQNQEEIRTIKGKLLIMESINQSSLENSKAVCNFDQYSIDILHNRILKSTIYKLIRSGINSHLKQQLMKIYPYFNNVRLIDIKLSDFKKIRLHRNNNYYKFILSLSELIFQQLIVNENTGKYEFIKFSEKRLHEIFELFIYEFYKKEQQRFQVKHHKIIRWQLNGENQDKLPIMELDIFLQGNDKSIIIDTKFYQDIFTERDKFKSYNMYQIYSYMNQLNSYDEKHGLLLYPHNLDGKEVDEQYSFSLNSDNSTLRFASIDLAQNWNLVKNRLLYIINSY